MSTPVDMIDELVTSMLRVFAAALTRVDALVGPAVSLDDDEQLVALRAIADAHVNGERADHEASFAEIERLIGAAERIDVPEVRERARDATARSIGLIRDGLLRVNALVGLELARSIADDELIGMLHVLAGTHPDSPAIRARAALEAATAELRSLSVRLVDVDDGTATSTGATSTGATSMDATSMGATSMGATSMGATSMAATSRAMTVRLAAERGAKIDDARVRGLVEMIVMTRAPDLEGVRVEIEGLVVADPEFVPLGRLRPSQAHDRCSLCSAPIAAKHDHLYAPDRREVVCACDGCAQIIPSSEYASYRRVRANVQRVQVADVAGWLDRLNVPVGVAALIRDDAGGARLAYPGPAGLVEASVDPAIWAALCDAVPDAATLEPEVEALVWSGLTREVLRTGIDVVFRLVGELRKNWRGITGGDGPAALSRVLAEIAKAAA